jgi:lipopolysaccharide transport system permease protein
VKYRDLRFALPFLAQLWMFATPIVYPASGVTKKWWWVIVSNPMSSIVEIGRRAFLGVGTTSGAFVITGAAMAVVVLVTGVLIFNRVQRTFVDTI